MGELKVDFAIITAIELERQAVCKAFGMGNDDRVLVEPRIYWRKSLELKDGKFYNIVVAQSSDIAGVDAALLVSDIIHHWHPGAILLVGIAAGVDREKQQFGDVVIASDVYYYERGKMTPDGKRPEPIMYRPDFALWTYIQAIPEWAPPSTLVRSDGTQTCPKIHRGVIASGEKVIADSVVRDEITAEHRKIAAIEMEGYGFSAGVWQSFERVRPLVIKAICDFADVNKGDDWHSYAAAVAAEFTKHFLLDRPLLPRNSPRPSIPPPNGSPYRLIIDALKNGNLVPFLGPGINSRFYTSLALELAELVENDLLAANGDTDPRSGRLIQALIGIPCSVCPYWPEDRPPECPMLQSIDGSDNVESCPLYIEQGLAVSKINLRYLSQYCILRSAGTDSLYYRLDDILSKLEQNYQPNSLHQFLAELPRLMLNKGKPVRSPGLPFQLIVTTNYDDMLERAFLEAQQPFDVVFYVADGAEKGKFKHHPYKGEPRIIEGNESNSLPLRDPLGHLSSPRLIILKLFGTWENAWENNFVATEEQMAYLISTLKQSLPVGLFNALIRGNVLFMGYSPNDSDLQLLVNCLWPNNRISGKSWLLHQAKPSDLEQELWKTRNVELLDMPSSLDDFVNQLQGAIEKHIQ